MALFRYRLARLRSIHCWRFSNQSSMFNLVAGDLAQAQHGAEAEGGGVAGQLAGGGESVFRAIVATEVCRFRLPLTFPAYAGMNRPPWCRALACAG